MFGRNDEGDRYYTDGEVHILVLTERGAINPKPPAELPDPPLIALKDGLWHGAREATGFGCSADLSQCQ